MSYTSFLEIVQLKSGEIVLKRADDDSAPLISICFSEESKSYMGDAGIQIARIMIQAGIQAAAQIHNTDFEVDALHEEEEDDNNNKVKPILH